MKYLKKNTFKLEKNFEKRLRKSHSTRNTQRYHHLCIRVWQCYVCDCVSPILSFTIYSLTCGKQIRYVLLLLMIGTRKESFFNRHNNTAVLYVHKNYFKSYLVLDELAIQQHTLASFSLIKFDTHIHSKHYAHACNYNSRLKCMSIKYALIFSLKSYFGLKTHTHSNE